MISSFFFDRMACTSANPRFDFTNAHSATVDSIEKKSLELGFGCCKYPRRTGSVF